VEEAVIKTAFDYPAFRVYMILKIGLLREISGRAFSPPVYRQIMESQLE